MLKGHLAAGIPTRGGEGETGHTRLGHPRWEGSPDLGRGAERSFVPGGCEGRCEGSTHPCWYRGVAVSPRLPLAGLTQPGSARSGRMEGGGQRSLEGCSFAVQRCFINHRPALGWGGPSVCPSISMCHTAKDAEEWGEESAEPVGALLSGRASQPPGKDGIAPGGKGCWQIQPCVEYYGPKWERLVIRKPLHAGLTWCRLQKCYYQVSRDR